MIPSLGTAVLPPEPDHRQNHADAQDNGNDRTQNTQRPARPFLLVLRLTAGGIIPADGLRFL